MFGRFIHANFGKTGDSPYFTFLCKTYNKRIFFCFQSFVSLKAWNISDFTLPIATERMRVASFISEHVAQDRLAVCYCFHAFFFLLLYEATKAV